MSKKDIDQALDSLMGTAPGPNRVREKAENTIYDNDKSTTIGIRILKTDKERLEKHFKMKGHISLSVPIRELIYKYMQDNNLL